MAALKINELERVRYWQGQLLASGDLQTQLLVDAEMRRLHNRDIHQAYGIAIGLELERDATTGKLTLSCGLAYDCAGRELVLQSNRAVELPSQFPMTLVLTRDMTSVDGIALIWKAPHQVNPNTEIAITTLSAGVSNPIVDPQFRAVVARPLARPRLANGQTIPGETTWQPWKIGDTEVGVKVVIDTSAAGFTRQPHYFAEVVPGKPTKKFVPAWLTSLADPSPQGFTLQLMLHRITRASLDIVDVKAQVTKTPALDRIVTLESSGLFAIRDSVARVLPLAERAALIKSLSGSNVTLETALANFSETKDVAFGNPRREAVVKSISSKATFFEATVDHPERFNVGDVVVKLNGQLEGTRPSRVVSVDDAGILELSPAIVGLVVNDTLGIAKPASSVLTVNDTKITVANPSLYSKDDVVVRLADPVETSAPAKIMAKEADGTLVLSKAIMGLQSLDSLGIGQTAGEVLDVEDNSSEIKIEVDNAKNFRKGDLVAKNHQNGSFSAPVRVERVFTSGTHALGLSNLIPGLTPQDTIVAADFRVRATVLNIQNPATNLTVADASPFASPSYVAKIDDLFKASLPAAVNATVGQTLTLDAPIEGLTPGDVIGLCSFPVTVTVNTIQDDGTIDVSAAGLLRAGDIVTALPAHRDKPSLALVIKVTGTVIKVSGILEDLEEGDRLSVANIRGVVRVTPNPGPTTVTVNHPTRLRFGDFLSDIRGWRQMQGSASIQSVAGNQIALNSQLDGLLINDTVGMASIFSVARSKSPFFIFFFNIIALRLNETPDLLISDEVLIVGLDRLRGETRSVTARVQGFISPNTVVLFVPPTNEPFTFRPEDITASVLFVRGSPLALIQKHDLYVTWFAVGEPDQMPRPCIGTEPLGCDCSPAKE